jgi:2-dehydro-3-deoxygluconokinase
MTVEKVWDVVGLGEALIEFNRRRPDEPVFWMGYGGDTSNCVIAAARLGARCAYVTQVGDDDFGQELLALWRREQVDTDGVRVLAGAPTGIYFVSHGADGHRFSYRRSGSAASRMTPAMLPHGLIAQARWLHVSGISLAISDSARETVALAIETARANATQVSFDLNFRPALVSATMALETLRETLPHCDLFLPSVDEIAALTGIEAPEAIVRWCHEHGARQVVLKLGARGCLVSDGKAVTELAAVAVQPVDATGAGDCFAGACLAQLAGGASLVDAARIANRAAALSTQGYGAIDPCRARTRWGWPEASLPLQRHLQRGGHGALVAPHPAIVLLELDVELPFGRSHLVLPGGEADRLALVVVDVEVQRRLRFEAPGDLRPLGQLLAGLDELAGGDAELAHELAVGVPFDGNQLGMGQLGQAQGEQDGDESAGVAHGQEVLRRSVCHCKPANARDNL